MSTSGTAKETLRIVEQRGYTAPSGRRVDLSDAIGRAFDNTLLYTPEEAGALILPPLPPGPPLPSGPPRCSVTPETTTAAARRLCAAGARDLLALNFASAKNPGGGFLGGAKAQEEDLARASALYPCQLLQPAYYAANRACGTMLYTDHIIHTRDVPFFRDDRLALLDEPFLTSVLTAPAPNAGQHLRQGGSRASLHTALLRRGRMVLDICAHQQHRTLILGGWGCGVFQNDPQEVAEMFHHWLHHPDFSGYFDEVVFAIYDRTAKREVISRFEQVFSI